MPFELIPAIDILNGNVVRLHKGDYEQVTVYSDDPVSQAKKFHAAGAERMHVVDLDGARDGKPVNLETIRNIVSATPLKVQVGGGIRNERTAESWFEAGVSRVVLGTAAVKDPAMTERLARAHPTGVVVAIDARDGEVAVEGWLEGSGRDATELAREVDAYGVDAILFTNINRDGTSEGPDVAATVALQNQVRATVIASGGVGAISHLTDLAKAGARASVCGRALYNGSFTVEEALAAIAEVGKT